MFFFLNIAQAIAHQKNRAQPKGVKKTSRPRKLPNTSPAVPQKHNGPSLMRESLQINARKRGVKNQGFHKHLFYHIDPVF